MREEAQGSRAGIVTFATDFGWSGGYVAACEAVIATIEPTARIIHLSHEIAVGDIRAGALVLARVAPLCPPCVHLAVVDPGVGTARRPLALLARRGDLLVGPDNGLLLPAAEALGGVDTAWALDAVSVRTAAGLAGSPLSHTFHGRDIFAPAAALLASGRPPSTLGTETASASLIALPPLEWESCADGVLAEVVEIDRFGNVELAIPFPDLPPGSRCFSVELEGEGSSGWSARVVATYGELRPGELGLLEDSWGMVALALNGASAAELLSVERGMGVRLQTLEETRPSPADKRPRSS